MTKIQVLIGDSRELIAIAVNKLIEESENCQVVAICNTGDEAIALADKHKPDIALIDINILGTDSTKTVRRIKELSPHTRAIIITAESQYAVADPLTIFDSKAEGYVDIDVNPTRLINAISRVHSGGNVMSPTLAGRLIRKPNNEKAKTKMLETNLSKREEEVLLLVNKGKTNKEIAAALYVTENTVKAHLHSILKKLEADTRQKAAFIAREMGVFAK